MKVQEKMIELYDSMGRRNPENRKYMENMRVYFYRELTKGTPEAQRPTYDTWKTTWSYRDKSALVSPKQGNLDDCGVFTLVSIYLLSQGVELSRNTYDQSAIDSRKVRRSIAHLILEKNQSQEEVQRTASIF